MAIMAMATVPKTKLFPIFSCILFLSAPGLAAEIRLKPAIKVEGTYSDNVELSSVDKVSTFVTQTGVTLEQDYLSKVLQFDIDLYSRYAIYSHDSELNKDYHDLESTIRYALWPNGITFFGGASIVNEARNSARNSVSDIVTGDTIQVQRYNAGFQYALENSDVFLNSAIGFNRNISEDNIGEQQGYFGRVESRNSNQARYIFWDLKGSYQYLENNNRDGTVQTIEVKVGAITQYKVTPFLRFFDENNSGNISTNGQDLASNSYGIGARWLVSPRLFVDLSYNKPKDGQVDLDGKELKEYIDAKVFWQPTIRTKLDGSFSQRFYGNSYSLSFEHRNRRLTNNITYDESVRAFTRGRYESESQGFYWCPKGDVEIAAECFLQSNSTINSDDYNLVQLNNFNLVEDNEFSLNKSLSWRSVLELPRTSFSLAISGNQRKSLSTFVENENIAASFSINRKISGRSSVNFITTYNEDIFGIETEEERKNTYIRYSAEYVKQLNKTLDTTFGLSHLDRESSLATDNYKEGRVYFQVKKGF